MPIPPSPGGGNRIKLLGKKIKWGRSEAEGKKEGGGKKEREEGKGKQRGKKGRGREDGRKGPEWKGRQAEKGKREGKWVWKRSKGWGREKGRMKRQGMGKVGRQNHPPMAYMIEL